MQAQLRHAAVVFLAPGAAPVRRHVAERRATAVRKSS
jgi:hypothetical protein